MCALASSVWHVIFVSALRCLSPREQVRKPVQLYICSLYWGSTLKPSIINRQPCRYQMLQINLTCKWRRRDAHSGLIPTLLFKHAGCTVLLQHRSIPLCMPTLAFQTCIIKLVHTARHTHTHIQENRYRELQELPTTPSSTQVKRMWSQPGSWETRPDANVACCLPVLQYQERPFSHFSRTQLWTVLESKIRTHHFVFPVSSNPLLYTVMLSSCITVTRVCAGGSWIVKGGLKKTDNVG